MSHPSRVVAHAESFVARRPSPSRASLVLCTVFLLIAAFYLWTAGTSFPLTLGAHTNPYNELASAFLHFRLSVGTPPAGLLRLSEPYSPTQNLYFRGSASIHDFALYHGQLYLTWGPVPALLLMPFHLLGLEPSASLITPLFAAAGFGFALATLRVLLTRLVDPSLWMCALAAVTLGVASAVPFILRRPAVYEEAITSGYCFDTVALWLVMSSLIARKSSPLRLIAMSLCFGLAAGSRPTLALTAVLLVPVYISLRSTYPRRELVASLAIPVGICLLLLMGYNQARFGNPLEVGAKYQLAGFNPRTAHFADLSYVLPGVWNYLLAPPRLTVLFPFISLPPPPMSYPLGLPAGYLRPPEVTGGLLPMAPILLFLIPLPWVWRRRSALLGAFAGTLLVAAGAALLMVVFLAYEFFGTTERYEIDFSTLLLCGAVTTWLALSGTISGRGRRMVRLGGALLATWSCLTGIAVSFVGYSNLLATNSPNIWTSLEDITSPLSTAISRVIDKPVVADVITPNITRTQANYTTLGFGLTSFWLGPSDAAAITIVSPNDGKIALIAHVAPGPALAPGAIYGVQISGIGRTPLRQQLPPRGGTVSIPLRVSGGITRFVLSPIATAVSSNGAAQGSQALVLIEHLSVR